MARAEVNGSGLIRTLIVDDHPITRLGIRTLLAEIPSLNVQGEAGSLAEARQWFAHSPPDLAVIDLKLKDGSGLDLVREQRSHTSTRFVVLTMFGCAQVEDAVRATGAHAFVAKESASRDLARVVREVLDGVATAAPPRQSRGSLLSPREREVLAAIVDGLTNAAIAARLKISVTTVRTHVVHILDKLGAYDRTEAAVIAVRRGLVEVGPASAEAQPWPPPSSAR